MNNINRLKLELGADYLTDEQYTVILSENSLDATEEYSKYENQKNLLYSVIDVLEIASNDVDYLRRIATETLTTDSAFKALQSRIKDIQNRINNIPDASALSSPFSLLYRRG